MSGKWAVAVLVGLLLAGAVRADPPRRQITLENARQVEPGVHYSRVERLLGPPRDETDGRLVRGSGFYAPCIGGLVIRDTTTRYWVCDEMKIAVEFSRETGRVVGVTFSQPELQDIPAWELLANRVRRHLDVPPEWMPQGPVTRRPSRSNSHVHTRFTGGVLGGKQERR